jgi:hypothetical protein
MIQRGSDPSPDSYSPQRRTALVLSGTGTAGAYHAGVLRALHEAGVKIDIVAGRGIGAVGALFAAVDGAQRLWEDKGYWQVSTARAFYPWRITIQLAVWVLVAAIFLVAAPLAAMAFGLVVFPIDFVLKMAGATGAGGLTAWYVEAANAAFHPSGLPTWLPRLVVLLLGSSACVAIAAGFWRRLVRRPRGARWWRVLPPPLSSAAAIDYCWRALWDLVRGATPLKQPGRLDLARRYTEMLADNLGQPGFRELLLVSHDVDAGRDLVFALVTEPRRRGLLRRSSTADTDSRRGEVIDLAGAGRDHLPDAIAAALSLPLVTDFHVIQFAAEGFWRGEAHRLADRPASLERLVQELVALDVDQIVLVPGSPDAGGPHALAAPRIDGRGRLGEYLQSSETAAVRDVLMARACSDGLRPRTFVIHPAYNPIGPLDFTGGFDDRSGRRSTLAELVSRGYEDAYRQFIEPVVGASGDRVGRSEV